ncbi:MAG: neutral/alkaline non-lysosomal ceramidase N-terminal domain-containing protein [Armatimonadota bacterium]
MGELRVGAAELDITPSLGCVLAGSLSPRYAEDVSYPLLSKAVVFDDGETQVAYVQNDLIVLDRAQFEVAKARAQQLTGIPAANIMMSCTHTHYGPATLSMFEVTAEEEYVEWALRRIGDAVKLAQNRLEPAVIGHTSGSCPEETHNRRWWMADGSVMMNPPVASPDLVRPAGPTDPEVALLVAETPEGEPIAAIANFSLHYVGGPGNVISADYFGAFAEALQRMAGSDFVAIMANGCCGDTNNIDRTRPPSGDPPPYPEYRVDRVGNAVAAEAYKRWAQLEQWSDEITVAAANAFPVYRRRTAAEEEARTVAGGQRAVEQIAAKWPQFVEAYARERQVVDQMPLEMETVVQALRIGDLAMVGFPGEFFVEYGLNTKRNSPFARTMTIELANDWIGYVPTDRGLDQGGYETWLATSARVAKGSEELFLRAASDCLARVAPQQ